jgi:MoxR-like ATPase
MHPRGAEEFEILRRMSVDPPHAEQVLTPELLRDLQRAADQVFIHNHVADYIVRLVMSTRSPVEFGMPELEGVIEIGASPRATLGLAAGARAVALIHGRNFVLPQDVVAVAREVMAHRLVLTFDSVADGVDPRAVVERVVGAIAQPHAVWNSGAVPEFR